MALSVSRLFGLRVPEDVDAAAKPSPDAPTSAGSGPVLLGITALFLIAAAAMVGYSEWGQQNSSPDSDSTFVHEEDIFEAGARLADAHRRFRQTALGYLLTGRSDYYQRLEAQETALRGRVRDLQALAAHSGAAESLDEELSAYIAGVRSQVDLKVTGRGYDPSAVLRTIEDPSIRANQEKVIAAEVARAGTTRAQALAAERKAREARELIYRIIAVGLIAAAILLIAASLREIIRWRSLAERVSALNRESEEARLAAEEANAAKGHFIKTVSHDIRQPLHAITLYLDILARRIKDTGAEPIVERIGLAAASMSRMSRQLLDLSRYDATGYSPVENAAPLDPLIQAVVADSAALAWGAGVKLRAGRTSLSAVADPALVESVLRNLVWNAILYSPGGSVLVGARRDPEGVRLEVYDNGPGLPPDKADFLRGVLTTRSIPLRPDGKGGLGLGLSIVKRGAELLGGHLEVNTRPGRTRFALRLRAA